MHDEAIRAAARAVYEKNSDPDWPSWETVAGSVIERSYVSDARAAITAFLERVEVSDATVAAIQRSEEWSSFWSPDDAAALCRAMIAQLRREL